MNKTCTKCGEEKPLDDFYKEPLGRGGRKSRCKTCVKDYRQANSDREKAYQKAYSLQNSDLMAARSRAWRRANVDRYKEYCRAHYQENSLDYKVKAMKRRAAKLQRTPAWADQEAIKQIYETCPTGYEVDHIVPLQGKTVSGLHVPENLQHLPASENRAKGNKYA